MAYSPKGTFWGTPNSVFNPFEKRSREIDGDFAIPELASAPLRSGGKCLGVKFLQALEDAIVISKANHDLFHAQQKRLGPKSELLSLKIYMVARVSWRF